MSTINFEFGSLIQGRQNNMGVFDADINPDVRNATTNADLTLYVRIHFQKVDPSGGVNTYNDYDGTAVPIRAWRDSEWESFRSTFLRGCRHKWHGKFWLKTPATYDRLNWPTVNPTHRCNLYCRFEISEQSTSEGAHAVIPVVRVDGNHFFRSHMLLYSNRDLRPENLTRGSRFYTHVHEIGHLIGLNHPGEGQPGCPTGGEHACYAAADGSDTGAMARGSVILPEYASPWQKAAATLTSTQATDWQVSMQRAYPVRL
ncbi:MAG: hypothetical protein KDA45_07970 [Planctomycetales bacterium]|nr:hypothetical protein [Planctomycetales bacterium]